MMQHSIDFSDRLAINQSSDAYACTCSSPQTVTIHSLSSWATCDEVKENKKEKENEPMKLEDIKDFFEKNKKKYDIEYSDDYVNLYLKTESELKPFSTIIDSNGDIVLNMQNKPKDMDYIWIEDKGKNCACETFATGCSWDSNDNNIQRYTKILKTLSGDNYNYYKVRVLFKDIKNINGSNLKINATRMEIANKVNSTPEITFEITDVRGNGDLIVVLKNSLTHSTSPEFRISAKYESEIVPAIEKKIEDMHTAVELAKNKGTIYTINFSAGLQDYIIRGE